MELRYIPYYGSCRILTINRRVPFPVPKIVRHPDKHDPKQDPNLENYPPETPEMLRARRASCLGKEVAEGVTTSLACR